MNHPHAIGKPQTQVGVFPGVAQVKAEVPTKFGSLQVAKPSAPRRLLDKLLTGLHLRSKQVVLGPPPQPRKSAVLPSLLKGVVSHANQLGLVGSDHPHAPDVQRGMAEKLESLLKQVRSGAVTPDMSPELTDALASGDQASIVAALKKTLLEATNPGQQERVGKVLDDHLASIVGQDINAEGPLVASAPGSRLDDKPALLQDKIGLPVVRLQALGVSKDAMAPMLKTLEKISDALFNGDNARADRLLTGLMDQLRPILEQQPKAVQLAFAQGDGKAFMADLRDAVLGQTNGDIERRQVAAQLDHFMDRSLSDAFKHLVKDLPGAQNVKGALPHMPDSANVGVLAMGRLASAVQRLAEAKAQNALAPDPQRMDQAVRDLDIATSDLLRLVRDGAAGPAMNDSMKQALAQGNMSAFVSALSAHVQSGVPASQREAMAQGFEQVVTPTALADEKAHGPLKVVHTGPTLVPKTTFDAPLLNTNVRLDALAATPEQRVQIEAALTHVALAMAHGDPAVIRDHLGRLAKLLQPILAQQDEATRLAFTLSNGEAFIGDLAHAILSQAPAPQRNLVGTQLNLFMRPYLLEAFDQVVTQALDKALQAPEPVPPPAQHKVFNEYPRREWTYQRVDSKPKSESELSTQWEYVNVNDPADKIIVTLPRKTIELQGRTYVRDEMTALASGNFGAVWSYTNPENPDDRVVLKVPKPGSHAPGSAAARKVLIDDPLRETAATQMTMGVGGGDSNKLKHIGTLRGPEGVYPAFSFVGGGTLRSKVNELHWATTSPALARGKLGLLADLVAALRQLHESKGLAHLDVALRNVLLDDKGRAVLADFGLSRPMPEGGSIDGASLSLPTDAMMPILWMAPEVLKGGPVTAQSEVFSLGMAFIELVYGLGEGFDPLWPGKSLAQVKEMIRNDQWDASGMMQALGTLSPSAWPDPAMRQALVSLITRMIDQNPANRPTLAEIAKSPLFEGISDEDRKALLNFVSPPPPPPAPPVVVQAPESDLADEGGYQSKLQLAPAPVNGGFDPLINYNLRG